MSVGKRRLSIFFENCISPFLFILVLGYNDKYNKYFLFYPFMHREKFCLDIYV